MMIEFTPTTASPTPPPLSEAVGPTPLTPASAVAAAAQLAPRLLARAAATDQLGGFPTQEMTWLREAGLLTAALPPPWAARAWASPPRRWPCCKRSTTSGGATWRWVASGKAT
ncbi:MAG: hypothetical protein WKG07_15450 [Hymenobacter sp.]